MSKTRTVKGYCDQEEKTCDYCEEDNWLNKKHQYVCEFCSAVRCYTHIRRCGCDPCTMCEKQRRAGIVDVRDDVANTDLCYECYCNLRDFKYKNQQHFEELMMLAYSGGDYALAEQLGQKVYGPNWCFG